MKESGTSTVIGSMKTPLLLPTLSLLSLLAGCDIKTGDDAEDFDGYYYNSGYGDPAYYDPVYGGYALEQHTLIGNLEVVDSNSRMPLQGVNIEGWIYDDGILRKSFVVRTTDLGIARIETTFQENRRPFSHLEIRILEPGFRPLSSSISIQRIDRLVDDRGYPTTVYEASDVFYLSP